jgi:hypothetical protein
LQKGRRDVCDQWNTAARKQWPAQHAAAGPKTWQAAFCQGGGAVRHVGSCHCGAVRIEVEAPAEIVAYECNCSMCARTAFLHLIVPAGDMAVIAGESMLATYTFNTGVARHYFCTTCGCRPYYVPRSNPDGFSVNVRCLEPATIARLTVLPFDGQHWEDGAAALAHLSNS